MDVVLKRVLKIPKITQQCKAFKRIATYMHYYPARNSDVIVLLYCKFPYIYDHYLCTESDLRYSAIFSLNQNHRLLRV